MFYSSGFQPNCVVVRRRAPKNLDTSSAGVVGTEIFKTFSNTAMIDDPLPQGLGCGLTFSDRHFPQGAAIMAFQISRPTVKQTHKQKLSLKGLI
jgi:hypothetical protein